MICFQQTCKLKMWIMLNRWQGNISARAEISNESDQATAFHLDAITPEYIITIKPNCDFHVSNCKTPFHSLFWGTNPSLSLSLSRWDNIISESHRKHGHRAPNRIWFSWFGVKPHLGTGQTGHDREKMRRLLLCLPSASHGRTPEETLIAGPVSLTEI